MDEEDEHSPSEYYYPEDLETFNTETEPGFTESQEAIRDFINQQKSAKTNKKTATDINTLFHYMDYGIQRSIQRYLSQKKYSFNILKDNEFENLEISPCRELGESRFTSTATGNKPQAVQAIDKDEEFYNSDPASCTSKSWDEIRKLRWGDVQLQPQNGGQEVLVWLAKLGMKTRHGQERGHQRAFQLKIYATNTQRDVLSVFTKNSTATSQWK